MTISKTTNKSYITYTYAYLDTHVFQSGEKILKDPPEKTRQEPGTGAHLARTWYRSDLPMSLDFAWI